MELFGDFDIANASDDPFNVPDGVYRGKLVMFEKTTGTAKATGKTYAGIQAVFHPEDEGMEYQHFFGLPGEDDTDYVRDIKLSSIKRFLSGMGVPVDRMNSVEEDDLVGTKVIYKITTSKPSKTTGRTYKNIEVRLDDSSFTPSAPKVEEETVSTSATSSASLLGDDDPFGGV